MCRPLQVHHTALTDQPGVAVGVTVWAARRRHHRPTALGGHQVADEVVREIITPRFGHRDVLSRTTDRAPATTRKT
jgi:hypothetical protein